MKKFRILALAAVILGVLLFFGISFLRSPEYALLQIAVDVKECGIEGIRPHLTDDAKETFDAILTITESKLVREVTSLFTQEDHEDEDEKALQWKLKDITKNAVKNCKSAHIKARI